MNQNPRKCPKYKDFSHFRNKKMRAKLLSNLVGLSGLEPPTPTLSGWCSNRLSYIPIKMVEINGFEPLTPCLQGRCSSQLSYTPTSLIYKTFLSQNALLY